MRVLFDTSVLVTAVVDQLPNHEVALSALRAYSTGGNTGYCSTHALAECYATLTALPLPTRIQPDEARLLVEESFVATLTVVPLNTEDYLQVIRDLSAVGLGSGAVYDALHLRCAQACSSDRLLTYNLTHFRRLASGGVVVSSP